MNPSNQNNNDQALKANGRFGRFSYLAWNCVISLVMFIVLMIFTLILPIFSETKISSHTLLTGPAILIGIIYIIPIYFSFIFMIRRLHDRNHSGWFSLLFFVPIANLFLALYLLFAPGDIGENNYGPQRITLGWESLLAWAYIILIILGAIGIIILTIMSYTNSV